MHHVWGVRLDYGGRVHSSLFLLGLAVWYFVGYASLTTLSFALTSVFIFAFRAWQIGSPTAPWEYVLYGVLVFTGISLGIATEYQPLDPGK